MIWPEENINCELGFKLRAKLENNKRVWPKDAKKQSGEKGRSWFSAKRKGQRIFTVWETQGGETQVWAGKLVVYRTIFRIDHPQSTSHRFYQLLVYFTNCFYFIPYIYVLLFLLSLESFGCSICIVVEYITSFSGEPGLISYLKPSLRVLIFRNKYPRHLQDTGLNLDCVQQTSSCQIVWSCCSPGRSPAASWAWRPPRWGRPPWLGSLQVRRLSLEHFFLSPESQIKTWALEFLK